MFLTISVDETENYLYLCGYVNNGSVEQPLLIQLDKSGNRTNTKIMEPHVVRLLFYVHVAIIA